MPSPPSWQIQISDLSREMVVSAQQTLKEQLPNLAYTVCDAQRLPFPEGTFQVVIADGVLDQVHDLDGTLSEVERVLGHGGCLYAATGGEGHLIELRELVNAVVGQAQYGRRSDQFTLENGASLLEVRFPTIARMDYVDRLVFQEAQPIEVYARSEPSMASILTGEFLARFSRLIEQRLAELGQIEVSSQKGLFRACKG